MSYLKHFISRYSIAYSYIPSLKLDIVFLCISKYNVKNHLKRAQRAAHTLHFSRKMFLGLPTHFSRRPCILRKETKKGLHLKILH